MTEKELNELQKKVEEVAESIKELNDEELKFVVGGRRINN